MTEAERPPHFALTISPDVIEAPGADESVEATEAIMTATHRAGESGCCLHVHWTNGTVGGSVGVVLSDAQIASLAVFLETARLLKGK